MQKERNQIERKEEKRNYMKITKLDEEKKTR